MAKKTVRKSKKKATRPVAKKPVTKNVARKKTPIKVTKRASSSSKYKVPNSLQLKMFDLMVKSRALEERLIKIYKSGEAFFWIGAPGEEAFGVPLGLLAKKGQGPKHDWLHLHYRATPTLIAMGMDMVDSIRLIMNRATDKCTGGRNFSNHYCYPEWNVAPVSSPIEVQYSHALGTAWVQRRHKAKSLTIVTGGDAGSAEGDFASCLVWASRPGKELPMLITVQNNSWGISTSYSEQHGEEFVADRGKAFGIRTAVINGNDPVESYVRLKEEMDYIRKHGKPVLLEAKVSRLFGHSSASGANPVENEICPLAQFEKKLIKENLISKTDSEKLRKKYEEEARQLQQQVRGEAAPTAESIWDNSYVDGTANWREF